MSADHWQTVAERWQLLGSPLRPIAADLAVFERAIKKWSDDEQRAPRGLILGVTPELYRLHWPTGSRVAAVDHTQAMIDALWPGPKGDAHRGEWTELPFDEAAFDVVLCDGGFHLLDHPNGQLRLVQQGARVLSNGGLFVLRLFVPPAVRESPAQVLQALDSGNIPNLNVLKLRLGMALQENEQAGVALHGVWDTLRTAQPDFPALAARLGWQLPHLQAIDSYRNSPNHYHFVSTQLACQLFCQKPGGFTLVTTQTCTYELGERCPIVVLRRQPREAAGE